MNDFSHPLALVSQHPIIIVIIAVCYIFAVIVGVMPPLPRGAGYFTTWGYSILQAFAANLDRIGKIAAQTAPVKNAEAVLGVQVPAGSSVTQSSTQATTIQTPAQ